VFPSEYEVRNYVDADLDAYLALMTRVGFEGWTADNVAGFRGKVLKDGFYLVVHRESGAVAATALANGSQTDLHPNGGELGWVGCDPDHRGMRLGENVSGIAVCNLIAAGFRDIYLKTDDYRLPAIKGYLRLGFEPLMYQDDMQERWAAVHELLAKA
jgi:mycothiol synthase